MLTRVAFLAVCLLCTTGSVWAQSENKAPDKSPAVNKSDQSTGRTVTPQDKGQKQPQGWTGPLTTGSGGSPPESPQGQSPPNMQAAPEGSSKTVVEPNNKTRK